MRKMTDEDIWALIKQTEREGMIDPPAGFQDEVLWQIRKKRKRKKDIQLFSYSAKVFMTMAATLFILFTVPETFDSKAWVQKQMASGQTEAEQANNDRQTEAEKADNTGPTESEQFDPVREKWTEDADRILNKFSQTLDQYCSKVNDGLDQLVKRRK